MIIKTIKIVLGITAFVLFVLNLHADGITPTIDINASEEEIVEHMMFRARELGEVKDEINLLSLTPFVWNQGYLINSDVEKKGLIKMVGRKTEFFTLKQDEQRLVFLHNKKPVVDIILTNENFVIKRESGNLSPSDAWFYIEHDGTKPIVLISITKD